MIHKILLEHVLVYLKSQSGLIIYGVPFLSVEKSYIRPVKVLNYCERLCNNYFTIILFFTQCIGTKASLDIYLMWLYLLYYRLLESYLEILFSTNCLSRVYSFYISQIGGYILWNVQLVVIDYGM